MLIFLFAFLTQEINETVALECSVEIYPREFYVGDSVYMQIFVENKSPNIIENFPAIFNSRSPRDIQFQFNFEDHVQLKWYDEKVSSINFSEIFIPHPLNAGEKRLMLLKTLQVPLLDELRSSGWEKVMSQLKETGNSMKLNTVYTHYDGKGVTFGRIPTQIISTDLVIKPRTNSEMDLINRWFENTPPEYFPQKSLDERFLLKYYSKPGRKESGQTILGQSPWMFIMTGNRYPSDPNAPETWQGWKDLEDSITPSTMRDEIRLTRILIQYCDTKDKKVLDELKEWFAGMNEVQRACMAKSIWDRVRNCYGNDTLLVPFRDLYHIIREYDNSGKLYFEGAF